MWPPLMEAGGKTARMTQPYRPAQRLTGLASLAGDRPLARRLSPGDTLLSQVLADRLANLLALRDPFRRL